MWVDDRGICHTVALPDPTEVMSEAFRQSLERLMLQGQEELDEAIENEEIRFFEERIGAWVRASDEAEFVAAAPPIVLLVEPVGTVDDLRQLITGIDERWRLDALMALDDYVS